MNKGKEGTNQVRKRKKAVEQQKGSGKGYWPCLPLPGGWKGTNHTHFWINGWVGKRY
jgi:hypothetical protein